ncbi:hypothetical protein [Sphingobium sp.]|uniref:hypothetical protein n=1 Tax=Sphingobium sp. TaxID=1912891 RepID=UPI003BB6ED33
MRYDPTGQSDPPVHISTVRASKGSGIVFFLVSLSLVLAIAFFYMTKEVREDNRADAMVQAVAAVGDQAAHIGESARKAGNRLLDKD